MNKVLSGFVEPETTGAAREDWANANAMMSLNIAGKSSILFK